MWFVLGEQCQASCSQGWRTPAEWMSAPVHTLIHTTTLSYTPHRFAHSHTHHTGARIKSASTSRDTTQSSTSEHYLPETRQDCSSSDRNGSISHCSFFGFVCFLYFSAVMLYNLIQSWKKFICIDCRKIEVVCV